MQRINHAGLALIKTYEGFSAKAYRCPAGYWTIGYGHRIATHETFPENISKAEAEALLLRDVQVAEKAVRKGITIVLNENQFSALVSFVYNIGSGAFMRSTLRKQVNAGNHSAIPRELLRWVWSNGRKLPGLVKRRDAEGKLYAFSI